MSRKRFAVICVVVIVVFVLPLFIRDQLGKSLSIVKNLEIYKKNIPLQLSEMRFAPSNWSIRNFWAEESTLV